MVALAYTVQLDHTLELMANESAPAQNGQNVSKENHLADSITSVADKDTRAKPWQTADVEEPAKHHDSGKGRASGVNLKKDDYWMAEGFVNASS